MEKSFANSEILRNMKYRPENLLLDAPIHPGFHKVRKDPLYASTISKLLSLYVEERAEYDRRVKEELANHRRRVFGVEI